jgi:nucleotide-binding universal stress UspA family protein
MPTSTLSPAALRPLARSRRASRALVVVADDAGAGAEQAVPDWVVRWCRRSRWELLPHPETGAGTAAAAARLDARVLVLRPDASHPVEREAPNSSPRVVAAVRNLPDDAPVVADAATCAALLCGRLTIVHAVPRSFAERSVGLEGAVAHGRRLLDAAASRATTHQPGVLVDCELLRVRPYELVGETLHADLLVVGGPRTERHAGGRSAGSSGPGLVAHSALYHAPCPVLLTPR